MSEGMQSPVSPCQKDTSSHQSRGRAGEGINGERLGRSVHRHSREKRLSGGKYLCILTGNAPVSRAPWKCPGQRDDQGRTASGTKPE